MKYYSLSLKLSEEIIKKVSLRVVSEGYGMRGRSRWLTEAVERFLEMTNFPEMVDMADELTSLDKVISLRLSEELLGKIEDAILKVRMQYPVIEGVKSKIIRASIMQRLIRNPEIIEVA